MSQLFELIRHAPSTNQIHAWAYSLAAEPSSDWDLEISQPEFGELLLELVNDDNCPKQSYALHCLYLLSADEIKSSSYQSNFGLHNLGKLRLLVNKAKSINSAVLTQWAQRCEDLCTGKLEFDYSLWCEGGYAKEAENAGLVQGTSNANEVLV